MLYRKQCVKQCSIGILFLLSRICPFKTKKSSVLFGIFFLLAGAMISDMMKGFHASEGLLKK